MENLPVPESLQPYMPIIVGAVAALVIFIIGWIASRWASALVRRMLNRRGVDKALSGFLASMAQYLVLAAAVVTALSKVGVETTSLVALLGAAGLAVGLALQGTLGHLASGVMILLFRPFTIGHRITAADHTGEVTDVGLFATTLVTPQNETIILPNGEVTSGPIVNYATLGALRAEIAVGVAYGTDLDRAMEVMIGAAKRADLVLDDPAPSAAFSGFGASSLDFSVRPWAAPENFPKMRHNVRLALYEDLNAAGIEIPFDQIVVHQG